MLRLCKVNSSALVCADLRTANKLRLELFHRRAGLEMESRDVASHFINVVWRHIRFLYLLDGQEQSRLQLLCASMVYIICPRQCFLDWLRKHEPNRGCIDYSFFTMGRLYREYHGSLLQRLYLKRLLSQRGRGGQSTGTCKSVLGEDSDDEKGPLLTGSYPLAMFMEGEFASGREWGPNDIDVFVTSSESVENFVEWYCEMVIVPLQLRLKNVSWKSYPFDEHHDEIRGRVVSSEDVPSVKYSHLSRMQLCDLIASWLREKLPECEECLNFEGGSSQESLRLQEKLETIEEHVPKRFASPTYKIVESFKLFPKRGCFAGASVPSSLLPINLIRVCLEPSVRDSDFPSTVFSNFDLLNCQVEATVAEDLSLGVWSSDIVRDLNRQRRLQFSTNSFASGRGNVHRTMTRVVKYMERGFHW